MTPEEIKEWRKDMGMSRKQFAAFTGYSEKTIANWEDGKPCSPIKLLTYIKNMFKVMRF